MVSDYFCCSYVNKQAKVNKTRLILQQVSLTMIIFDKNEDVPRERNGNPFQYSCLGNPMDRGAWWATVHEVAKSRTWLSMHIGPCKVLELNLDFPIKPRTTKQCYMLKESAYQQGETSRNPSYNISTSKNPLRILTPSLLSPRSRIKTDSICLAMESPSQEDKGVPDSQHLLVSNRSK